MKALQLFVSFVSNTATRGVFIKQPVRLHLNDAWSAMILILIPRQSLKTYLPFFQVLI